MCIEPIELWLDLRALRRGLIVPVDPDTDPTALLVQDSGMVPVNTQVAIVNPETCTLCRVGEYGEIWVQSDACAKAFYGSKHEFDMERFNGRVLDGDPSVPYVRTGDLGFLHSVTRPIGPGGQPVEMQVLFVLGGIGETFEVNGLTHFPMDIEASVEKSHRNIVNGGWSVDSNYSLPERTLLTQHYSAVFQAGGLIVVVVEVTRKAYLASLVPVIVNAILNEHQVVADIVAFVSHGDFPKSRLGEKQRGKILASWVTRKLRTIAQFSIRDSDQQNGQFAEVQHRASKVSKPGSLIENSSVRRSTLAPDSDFTAVSRSPIDDGSKVQYQSFAAAGSGEMNPTLPTLTVPESQHDDLDSGVGPLPSTTLPAEPLQFGFDEQRHGHDSSPIGHARTASHPIYELDDKPLHEQQVPPSELSSEAEQARYTAHGYQYPPSSSSRPGTHDGQPPEEWVQEALMYQSALGAGEGGDESNTAGHGGNEEAGHRLPSRGGPVVR